MKTVHYLHVLLTTILYLFCVAVHAVQPPSHLQVYETYAPAKIIRNYISPLLKDGETISLFGGKVIVNASAHTHSNILELLARIDHKAQKLLIHFRPALTANKFRSTHHKNNTIKQTPTIARFSGSSTNGKITVKKQNHKIDARLTNKEEQIALLEGKTGYLRGTTEGYKNKPVYANGFFTNKATLEKNGSGHYISARINGNIATLHFSKKEPKSIKNASSPQATSSSTNELTTPLGTWILIPSIDGQPSGQEIRVQLAP
ncbi:hypothetical protein A9Q81_16225 [Gammaproteobacteria bacterium 42_54_T18]|nr:hypothetical protein A9Q81_16225 [Gammaproteobacteria bacterium 42_54_T18]